MTSSPVQRRFARLVSVLALGACTGSISTVAPDVPEPSPGAGSPAGGAAGRRGGGAGASGGAVAGAAGEGMPAASACRLPPRRLVKLTPEQYDRTVRPYVYTGGARFSEAWKSTVGSHAGFYSNHADRLDMPVLHVWRIFDQSHEIATRATDGYSLYQFGAAVAKDNARYACPEAGPNEGCVKPFVRDWGARMFRRPLAPAELDRYVAFFNAQSAVHGGKRAFEMTVEALLMSPHLLYRSEIGLPTADGAYELTAFEQAQALSYLITDGPPDAELTAAAEAGALSRTELAKHAARLLAQQPTLKSSWPEWEASGGAIGLDKFFREYFEFEKIRNAPKGWRYGNAFHPVKAHGWDFAVGSGAAETRHFLHHWFWRDDATTKTLLGAAYTFANSELAAYYDAPLATAIANDQPLTKIPAPAHRRGLLTQVAFLGTYGKEWTPDMVHRGLYIRQKLLCGVINPPPPDVPSAASLEGAENKTYNEIIAEHSSNPKCISCHKLMDPLGRPFQAFDSAGVYRTMDTDRAFQMGDAKLERPLGDVAGEILGTDATDAKVTDHDQLIDALAASPDVGRCVTLNFYRYAQARHEADADECALEKLHQRTLSKGGNMREALLDIVTADDFVLRSQGVTP